MEKTKKVEAQIARESAKMMGSIEEMRMHREIHETLQGIMNDIRMLLPKLEQTKKREANDFKKGKYDRVLTPLLIDALQEVLDVYRIIFERE